METCPFCAMEEKAYHETEYFYALFDGYPVSKGHTLIIPKRHIETYFDLDPEEAGDLHHIIMTIKKRLDQKFGPDGYNIGINNGAAAGQTVFHLHVHIIPRYEGDMNDPRGGVRGVIPSKRIY